MAQFAAYISRGLCNPRLTFPRINAPINSIFFSFLGATEDDVMDVVSRSHHSWCCFVLVFPMKMWVGLVLSSAVVQLGDVLVNTDTCTVRVRDLFNPFTPELKKYILLTF